jgi:hypothetical protein
VVNHPVPGARADVQPERVLIFPAVAARALWSAPLVTAAVVLSLALGIGANTAIFSAMNEIVFQPLPVNDPSSLVALSWTPADLDVSSVAESSEGVPGQVFSYDAYAAIRDSADVFTGTAAFASNVQGVNVSVRGRAETAIVQGVSGTYFSVLGIAPAAGRFLAPADDVEGAPVVAVLSFAFWRRAFSASPVVVGSTFVVNGSPATIVGVAPDDLAGLVPGTAPDGWVSLTAFAAQEQRAGNAPRNVPFTRDRKTWWLHVFGRLQPDVASLLSPSIAWAEANETPLSVRMT